MENKLWHCWWPAGFLALMCLLRFSHFRVYLVVGDIVFWPRLMIPPTLFVGNPTIDHCFFKVYWGPLEIRFPILCWWLIIEKQNFSICHDKGRVWRPSLISWPDNRCDLASLTIIWFVTILRLEFLDTRPKVFLMRKISPGASKIFLFPRIFKYPFQIYSVFFTSCCLLSYVSKVSIDVLCFMWDSILPIVWHGFQCKMIR